MYEGSYLWRLRQEVGHDLVLMPGAMTVVADAKVVIGNIMSLAYGSDADASGPAEALGVAGSVDYRVTDKADA